MKFLMDSFVQDFNGRARNADTERLTQEMTQAFYRQEYETIDVLARKGALYTKEMLDIGILLKDPQLVLKCVNAGVVSEELKSFAHKHGDTALKKSVQAQLN